MLFPIEAAQKRFLLSWQRDGRERMLTLWLYLCASPTVCLFPVGFSVSLTSTAMWPCSPPLGDSSARQSPGTSDVTLLLLTDTCMGGAGGTLKRWREWIMDCIVSQTLGLSPYFLCLSGWPLHSKRICSWTTGITVVWENVITFFFPSCVPPPSLASPVCLSMSLICLFLFFHRLLPPPHRKWQQSCSSMKKRASHVKSECTSCANTSKARCVGTLLCLTRHIRDACLWSFPVVDASKWNVKLNSKFFMLKIRNDLPSFWQWNTSVWADVLVLSGSIT